MIKLLSKFIVKERFHMNVISHRLIDEAKLSMINYGEISKHTNNRKHFFQKKEKEQEL